MKKISEIISFELPDEIKCLEVSGICDDSRKASEGCLFVAIDGSLDDGKKYVDDAIARGAKYIVLNGEENHAMQNDSGITYIYVKDSRCELSHIASRLFPNDLDYVVAITGTNGKSSTVDIVRQIWTECGRRSASIGTLGVQHDVRSDNYKTHAQQAPGFLRPSGALNDGGVSVSRHPEERSDVGIQLNKIQNPNLIAHTTTPDPIQLHKILHDLSGDGVKNVALEASSHGICQHRLDDVAFNVCAFTNFTQDHLDYHGTMEDYWKAKERLFSEIAGENTVFVVNADYEYSKKILEIAAARNIKCITYGCKSDDIKVLLTTTSETRTFMGVSFFGKQLHISMPIYGLFQVYNALCAAAICYLTGIPILDIRDALENIQPICGRMELVRKYNGASVFLDYAHTPDALKNAIESVRRHLQNEKSRVITVFGCGGDRDREKRKLMGEVAAQFSDFTFVTDDNPRNEDPATIRKMIMEGFSGNDNKVIEVPSGRKNAIEVAMEFASKGDSVLIAGKGHENYQQLANEMVYFSDREVILNKA
ncbi:UDP-N-acetylmuramoyl-L-alanyl-D-glutamate--2,6-diaminopimelate ligase [Alphaproteobacteria bacterium]|nr:UDP-N-acetylmuramoyl-L-alanyl-D-glutamate--2,6-diaminopimelate ligase [Alphaproteobacteria bacterium]